MLVRTGDVIIPKIEASQPLDSECQHFLDCIEGKCEPINDGQVGLRVVCALGGGRSIAAAAFANGGRGHRCIAKVHSANGAAPRVLSRVQFYLPERHFTMNIPLVDLKAQYASLRDELNAAWQNVLDEACFILGLLVANFYRDFAAFCQVRHTIGVASGTDALHLILRGLEIGPGDEVIVPAFTFVAVPPWA